MKFSPVGGGGGREGHGPQTLGKSKKRLKVMGIQARGESTGGEKKGERRAAPRGEKVQRMSPKSDLMNRKSAGRRARGGLLANAGVSKWNVSYFGEGNVRKRGGSRERETKTAPDQGWGLRGQRPRQLAKSGGKKDHSFPIKENTRREKRGAAAFNACMKGVSERSKMSKELIRQGLSSWGRMSRSQGGS